MVFAIPKYTQYQLSRMVKYELDKLNVEAKDAPSHFSIDEELLHDILGEEVRFKSKHYQVVSKITGTTVENLLEDEEIKPISFRSVHDENDKVVIDKIARISDFFKDVALLKKLNGEIHVNK